METTQLNLIAGEDSTSPNSDDLKQSFLAKGKAASGDSNTIDEEEGNEYTGPKIGDILHFYEGAYNSDLANPQKAAELANIFIEDFKKTRLPGSLFDWLQRCSSSEAWYYDLEKMDKVTDLECDAAGITLEPIREQMREAVRKELVKLKDKVRDAISKSSGSSDFSNLTIVEGVVQIKDSYLESLRERYTVSIQNEAQLNFWKKWLQVKDTLEELGQIAKAATGHSFNQVFQISAFSNELTLSSISILKSIN